jgi:hypothetical protein
MNKHKEALQKIVKLENTITNIIKAKDIATEALQSEEEKVTGETSDGYHTFNELYEFRKVYNAALFNEWAAQGKYGVHKSIRHHDGEECFGGGWFIVVALLPTGQISNHYEMADWDLFNVPSFDKAQYEFDGHTPQDVVTRLKSIPKSEERMYSREDVLDLLCDYADLIHSTKSRKPLQLEWLDNLEKQNKLQSLQPKSESRNEEDSQIALVAWWNSKGDRYRETVLIEDAVKEFNSLSEERIYYTPNGNICPLKCSKSRMKSGECACHNNYTKPKSESRMYSESEVLRIMERVDTEVGQTDKIGEWCHVHGSGKKYTTKQILDLLIQSLQPKTEERKQHIIDIMKADEEDGLYQEPKTEELKEALKPCPNHPDVLTSQCGICNGTFPKLEQPKTEEVIDQYVVLNQDGMTFDRLSPYAKEFDEPKEQPTSPSIEKEVIFHIDHVARLLKQYDDERISFSKFCERLDEIAHGHHKANNSLEELEKWAEDKSYGYYHRETESINMMELMNKIEELKDKQ